MVGFGDCNTSHSAARYDTRRRSVRLLFFADFSDGVISAEQIKSVGAAEFVFIDTRSKAQFLAGHIAGANGYILESLHSGLYTIIVSPVSFNLLY